MSRPNTSPSTPTHDHAASELAHHRQILDRFVDHARHGRPPPPPEPAGDDLLSITDAFALQLHWCEVASIGHPCVEVGRGAPLVPIHFLQQGRQLLEPSTVFRLARELSDLMAIDARILHIDAIDARDAFEDGLAETLQVRRASVCEQTMVAVRAYPDVRVHVSPAHFLSGTRLLSEALSTDRGNVRALLPCGRWFFATRRDRAHPPRFLLRAREISGSEEQLIDLRGL